MATDFFGWPSEAGDGGWSVDDLLELPQTLARVELVDGSYVVTPPPAGRHQWVTAYLGRALVPQLPADEVDALENIGVTISSRGFRIPDLTVVRLDGFDLSAQQHPASQVLVAVEVVSPSSVSADRILKPAEYAAAGIPGYWRVELDPDLSLTAYALADGVYRELGTWGRGEVARVGEPFEAEIVIDGLLPPA